MIEGRESPRRRDVTSPRIDPNNRISKPTRPADSRPQNKTKYMTEDEQSRQFVADEDKFVLRQSKKKADIRLRERRAKPIDYLAFNLRFIDPEKDVYDDDAADAHIKVPTPVDIITGLEASRLTELESDISSYLVLETRSRNRDYWKALKALCADQKEKLAPQGHEGRVVGSVSSDIDKILAPKTFDQLEALEKQIKAKLRSDEDIDTDYWEQLLRSLRLWKSKAALSTIYEEMSQKRLELQQKGGAAPLEEEELSTPAFHTPTALPPLTPEPLAGNSSTIVTTQNSESNPIPTGTARFSEAGREDLSKTTKALYDREVARGVSENEEVFTGEESVSEAQPKWSDKYQPRKPRYFNRVQMGYEWNKYNQTHYDHDNPPPKVVQGYKFNIFYPELIDPTKAPTFKIIREHGRRRGESFAAAGEEDTCLIRFLAGPPYEDIAFRIVDREWDYSAKRDRGYRSSFDKVCLHSLPPGQCATRRTPLYLPLLHRVDSPATSIQAANPRASSRSY